MHDEVPMESIRPLRAFPVVAASDPDDVYRAAAKLMSRHRMHLPQRTTTMRARIQAAQLETSALLWFEYGTPTEIFSDPLEGYSTVHVPMAGHLEVEHDGDWHPVGTGTGAVFSEGSPVRMRWSGDLRLLVARIDQTALLERLGRLTRVDSRPLVFSPFLDRQGAGGLVTGAVIAASRAVESSGPGLDPRIARHFDDALVSALLLGHGHTYTDDLLAPVTRVVRAVVDHIEAHYASDLTAADLARVAGVSPRSLHDAFHRRFGVSPLRYLRDLRLDRARAALQSDPTATVASVAHAVGFPHPSRFAAAYRARFGEPPNRTSR
jgi:AraC-like DNA-binding protein